MTFIRLEPGSPLSWTREGSLLIGFKDDPNSRCYVIDEHQKEMRQVLSLCDGKYELEHVIQSGLAMGIRESFLRETLKNLSERGHLRVVNSVKSHAPQNIHSDAQLLRRSSAEIQANRAHHRVLVYGSGRTPAALVSALVANDVPVGWTPASKERVRDDELDGVRSDYLTKRWDDFSVAIKDPNIAVCFDVAHDSEGIEAQFPHAIVFPVIVHQRRLAIGPLLGVNGGLCGSCLNQIRLSNDADWSLTTAQLLHERRQPPLIATRWSNVLTWTLANYLLELIDTKRSSGLLNHSLELHPPYPDWRVRSWEQFTCTHRSTGEIPLLGQQLPSE